MGPTDYQSRMAELLEGVDRATPILIMGAGVVGSWTALSLVKSGFRAITVADFDKVEEVNMGPQLYGPDDLDAYKTEALMEAVGALTGIYLSTRTKLEDLNGNYEVAILGPDSKAARKHVLVNTSRMKNRVKHLFDVRTGAEAGSLMYVNTEPTLEWDALPTSYRETLEGDEASAQCGRRGTPYSGMIAAGLVTHALLGALKGSTPPAWVAYNCFDRMHPGVDVMAHQWGA